MPKTQFKSITIAFGAKKYSLPPNALKGLYEPNLEFAKANFDEATNTLYIHTLNGDGAGGYLAILKIVDGIYKERFVAYGF